MSDAPRELATPWWLRLLLLFGLIGLCLTGWLRSQPREPNAELRLGDAGEIELAQYAAGPGAEAFFKHAAAIAEQGDRQTNSPGCEAALQYVTRALAREAGLKQADPEYVESGSYFQVIRDQDVLLPIDHHDPAGLRSSLKALDGAGEELSLYAVHANAMNACTTPPEGLPGKLIWLGDGRREQWPQWDLTGRIAVLDFNSGDRWLDAAGAGAVGCIFLEPPPVSADGAAGAASADGANVNAPRTSYRQADDKYLGLLPLHLPRLYAPGVLAARVKSWAQAERPVTLHAGLRLETAKAPYVEVFIKGLGAPVKGSPAAAPAGAIADPAAKPAAPEPYHREILIVAHLDGRSVVPGLSPAGNETWAAAGWLSMVNYFARHPGRFDLRFVLFTGHWQDFAVERAWAERHYTEFGERIALTLGLDFSPDSRDFGVQAMNGFPAYANNRAFATLLTRQGSPPPPGTDPDEPPPVGESREGILQHITGLAKPHADQVWQPGAGIFRITFGAVKDTADRDQDPTYPRPDLTKSPRFYDASDPFRALGALSVSAGCSEPERPLHNTPLDQFDPAAFDAAAQARNTVPVKNLRSQFFYALNLLGQLAEQPRDALPIRKTEVREDYAGRVVLHLQLVGWDSQRMWYKNGVPGEDGVTANPLHTYVMVVPTNAGFSKNYPGPIFPRTTSPSRAYHRGLQSFAWSFIVEAPQNSEGAFDIPLVYAAVPDAQVTVLAFTLDETGQITHASDLGRHGEQAFSILNVDIKRPDLNLQVKLFPCGTLTLFDLAAPTRKLFSTFVEKQNDMQWGVGDIDMGEGSLLPIHSVQLAGSHTEPESYSWLQVRSSAMIFLPPQTPGEVIVGHRSMPMAILNNATDEHPEGPGYRLAAGTETRVPRTVEQVIKQSRLLTGRRLDRYRELGVASPAADDNIAKTRRNLEAVQKAGDAGDAATRWAAEQLTWKTQDVVYKESYKLLVDVVSTTIFYFLVLLPFAYLLERLLFPQVTLTRSAVAAGAIFTVFALLLYIFHPGFRLADNIVVALISFLVVILTLPALFLTMGRGLTMIRDWGRREMKQHSAGADATGVALAALSLAVSNMRRRKLRTSLTLTTITLLVLSLVVLTTTSADLRYRRTPSPLTPGSYRGVEIFNQGDHMNGLHEEMVALLKKTFGADCDVGTRRYLDPGYEMQTPVHSETRRKTVPSVMLIAPGDALIFPELSKPVADGGALQAGRWVTAEDRAAAVLPDQLAVDLGVNVGDTIHVYRIPLTVVGILDHSRYEQLLDVNQRPVTTYSFHTEQTNHREPEYNSARECVYVGDGVLTEYGFLYGPVRAMVFKPHLPDPAEWAKQTRALLVRCKSEGQKPPRDRFTDFAPAARERLLAITGLDGAPSDQPPVPLTAEALAPVVEFNWWWARLHTLADGIAALNLGLDIYMDDPTPPWLLTASGAVPTATGANGSATAGDRVLELSASADVSMKQSAMMIFPLLIAFFMILSIMIGSVYERKQEIYVFSAVGLAPRHVAIMFLAEAVVYAGIAAVLGYFLGIILLGSLRAAHLLPENFYPNYLGVFVIYSALLAFAATLLSALYPIWLAGRMVNPSLERTWSIDEAPVGRNWEISLPFIATDLREASGILCFLHHFLEFHVGSRSGGFALPDDPPRPVMEGELAVLEAPIWLAPFERNIVHEARVEAVHDPVRNLYLLRLRLHLISGQEALWQRSAHVFVDALRKQLLVWRGLTAEEMQRMLIEGDKFAQKSDSAN
ncbi:MAG TPA: FtsX-like permease family protein [Planctomycetota bacterium]|nr:FtsX-like permease family protein [Planctomycetota bacterium]